MAQIDPMEETREELAAVSKLWWLSLVAGVLWFFIAIVILQMDSASVTTVGVIVGAMFLFTGLEQFVLASAVQGWKWLWVIFGVFFVLAGLWALFNPGATTAALADSLGFLFLLVAIFWIIEAFTTRHNNELWWLGLLSGIVMLVLAFWVSGQFFFERVYILLVFAGVWAMLTGITDIIRAFQLRKLGKLTTG
ncbi:MAG: DUF308 domain-containing protein [Candidatus Nanopelagicales bacterium]